MRNKFVLNLVALLILCGLSTLCSASVLQPWKISVEIIYPKGGEAISGSLEIKYKYENTDVDAVNDIKLYLSLDGGVTYPYLLRHHIEENHTGEFSYTVNSALYQDSKNCVIKIEVIDDGTPPLKAEVISKSFIIDNSSPTKPFVMDEGMYTYDPTKLFASWISSENVSEIIEYFYAIGTYPYGENIVKYTSLGNKTSVIHRGLSLQNNQIYYISVKAKNSAGLISEPGVSDGIIYSATVPQIQIVLSPPLLVIAKEKAEENNKVDCAFTISAGGNVNFITEQIVYILPSREQQMPQKSISLSMSPGTSIVKWEFSLPSQIVEEALAGNISGNLTIKKILKGYDSEGREIEISFSLPIIIDAAKEERQLHEVVEVTFMLSNNIVFQNTEEFGTIKVKSIGAGGNIYGEMYVNDSLWRNFNLFAKSGYEILSFDTPPLPSNVEGIYSVLIKIVHPNIVTSGQISYKVIQKEKLFSEITIFEDFKLYPVEASAQLKGEFISITGKGEVRELPFGIGNILVDFNNLKIKDNILVGGEINYLPPAEIKRKIKGMSFKVKKVRFTNLGATIGINVIHPYFPNNNIVNLHITKLGFKPDTSSEFTLPTYKVVEIGKTKVEISKISIYCKDANEVQLTGKGKVVANVKELIRKK